MKKLYAVFMVICMAALVSCFSPWEGGEGTIRLEFSGISRAFVPLDNGDYKLLDITLTGPGGRELRETVTMPTENGIPRAVRIAVTPGDWIVSVREFRAAGLEAIGFSEPVTVRAGQSVGAPVQMMAATEVSSFEEFGPALSFSQVLVLTGNIVDAGPFEIEGTDITLISDGDFSIIRPQTYPNIFHELLMIRGSGRLTLGMPGMSGSITIDGAGVEVQNSLIYIATGTLVMHSGVTLTRGYIAEGVTGITGSAVTVGQNGSFTMHGGTISGNYGGRGAVVVNQDREFDWRGGTISGNSPDNVYYHYW